MFFLYRYCQVDYLRLVTFPDEYVHVQYLFPKIVYFLIYSNIFCIFTFLNFLIKSLKTPVKVYRIAPKYRSLICSYLTLKVYKHEMKHTSEKKLSGYSFKKIFLLFQNHSVVLFTTDQIFRLVVCIVEMKRLLIDIK